MAKKLFYIIQARMTSTRLPAKVMLPLCGVSVLELLLHRLEPFKEGIIVATTNNGSEKQIVELCKEGGYKYYMGDEKDVLGRFYNAALEFGAKEGDTIVRICSDSPMICHTVLSKLLTFYGANDYGYVSNVGGKYPKGTEAEIFSFDSLKNAAQNASNDSDREHVTPYIRRSCKNGFFDDNAADYSGYKLTLDEKEDYVFLQKLMAALGCNLDFSYEELLAALEGGF